MGKGKGQVCLLISLSDSASVVLLMIVPFCLSQNLKQFVGWSHASGSQFDEPPGSAYVRIYINSEKMLFQVVSCVCFVTI